MIDQQVLNHCKNVSLINDTSASAQALQKQKVNK